MENNVIENIKKKFNEDDINNKITQFIQLLSNYDIFDLLIKINNKIYNSRNESKKHNSEILEMTRNYIISLYMSNLFLGSNPVLENDLKIILEMSKVIIYDCISCSNLNTIEKNFDTFPRRMYELSYGKGYFIIEINILCELLKGQESLIFDVYGIHSEEIIEGLIKLVETQAMVAYNAINKKENQKHFFCINDITNWPKNFIADLSVNIGETKEYANRKKFANWYGIEMPMKYKPFICIDGKSYYFDISLILDSFYRALQKAIFNKNKNNVTIWKDNQSKKVEELSVQQITNILNKDAVSYTNNYYQIENKEWAENDAIIVFNNILFVLEVKSGSYTPKSALLDEESHIKSKDTLVNAPRNQCERVINKLKESKIINLYDHTHKNIKTTLNLRDFDYIIPIIVTLDPLGEVLSMLINEKYDISPISISLSDLATYSVFFENDSLMFIHFIIQRQKSITIKNIMVNDELDFLGSYLNNRNYVGRYNDIEKETGLENIGSLYIDNMHNEIDQYFLSQMQSKKPEYNLTPFVKNLIEYMSKNINKDIINLSIQILDQNIDFDVTFEKAVRQIILKQKQQNRFSSITIFAKNSDFIPIQLFVNHDNKIFADEEKVLPYIIATMKNKKYSKMYYIILNVTNEKITTANIKLLIINSLLNINTKEILNLQDHLKENSRQISKMYVKKIGRNDPCPCGSGKKYKKCCLNK